MLHSVAVCVPTHCYAVYWFMPTASGLPRPLPPPSPCMKWLLVSFKRNCRSGRISSVTRQCLKGDSVGLCVKRGYLWSYQANNATLKQCDYSRIHISCGEWFLSISQLIPNQLSWYMYRHYFLVMVRLPWKCHWKILHSLKVGYLTCSK